MTADSKTPNAELLTRMDSLLNQVGTVDYCTVHVDQIREWRTAIRELQTAYTAAHDELVRANADLEACREVANRLRAALEPFGCHPDQCEHSGPACDYDRAIRALAPAEQNAATSQDRYEIPPFLRNKK